MAGLENRQDAYGREVWDYLRKGGGYEVIERDDGRIDVSGGPASYFSQWPDWPQAERVAVGFARGRVLDIGCGAGRVAMHLQDRGCEVVAIDNSPLAVRTCQERGVRDARVLPASAVGPQLGRFDTVVMFGNNLGLLGGLTKGRKLLRTLAEMTGENGRILAASLDPWRTTDTGHLDYLQANCRRGRLAGQVRIRVRYQNFATPWFDYLLLGPAELRALCAAAGWRVTWLFQQPGACYVAMLEKRADRSRK